MNRKLTEKLKKIIDRGNEEAINLGDNNLKPEHLLLAILLDDNNGVVICLERLKINLKLLINNLYLHINKNDFTPKIGNTSSKLPFSKEIKTVLGSVDYEAEVLNDNHIDTTHFILSVLNKTNNINLRSFLIDNKITYNTIFVEIKRLNQTKVKINKKIKNMNKLEDGDDKKPINKTPNKLNKNSVLYNFCTDLNELVKEGKIDLVIGREKEIKRVSQILSRKKKNNPILVGLAGTGKTAIVEGIAMLIESDNPPRNLIGKKILSLDLTSLISGTKYRGQFEERMQVIMKELKQNQDIILFIDEIHTFVGAGNSDGGLDVSNILKPSLSRGEIQVIGATTIDEYREKIEKNGALARRFQQVLVEPTSVEKTTEILHKIKEHYEKYHNVKFTEDAINECVKLANKYMTHRAMPDSAIDIMDEVGANTNTLYEPSKDLINLQNELNELSNEKVDVIKKQEYEKAAKIRDEVLKLENLIKKERNKILNKLENEKEEITKEYVRNVVTNMINIPINQIEDGEHKVLSNLETILKNKVIGQDLAIKKISDSIKRSRLGIKSNNKPNTFIFVGNSGVGKSLLCKTLAKELYGSDNSLIRLDMSEFMEKHSVSKIIGAPPGYIGYEKGGELAEKVKNKPHSLIMLDEIEKAHEDIFNIFLQILDEGFVTDSLGRRIDFKNTTIIMTSNVGAKEVENFKNPLGFQSNNNVTNDMDRKIKIINKALSFKFKPEFLNRIDDIIVFNRLSKEDTKIIVKLEINKLIDRLLENGYKINITNSVINHINEISYDEKYGARPIQRAIQEHIETPIANFILEKGSKNEISLNYLKGEIVIK